MRFFEAMKTRRILRKLQKIHQSPAWKVEFTTDNGYQDIRVYVNSDAELTQKECDGLIEVIEEELYQSTEEDVVILANKIAKIAFKYQKTINVFVSNNGEEYTVVICSDIL